MIENRLIREIGVRRLSRGTRGRSRRWLPLLLELRETTATRGRALETAADAMRRKYGEDAITRARLLEEE